MSNCILNYIETSTALKSDRHIIQSSHLMILDFTKFVFLCLSHIVCIYTLLQVCVCYCFSLSSLMLFLLSWLILWLLSIDVLLLVINYGGGGLLRWLSGFQPALHRYPTIIIIRVKFIRNQNNQEQLSIIDHLLIIIIIIIYISIDKSQLLDQFFDTQDQH